MNGRDLYLSLTEAGHAVTPDRPEAGRLWIEPPLGVHQRDLKDLVIANKAALLDHARFALSAEAMAAESAATPRIEPTARERALEAATKLAETPPDILDAAINGLHPADRAILDDIRRRGAMAADPAVEPFPFGANSPSAPDGQGAEALARLRAAGLTVRINPATRDGLLVDGPLTDDLRGLIRSSKSLLLMELEHEAQQEEQAHAPDPFLGPGVGGDQLGEGAVLGQPDGVDVLPGAGGECGGGGPVEGAAAGQERGGPPAAERAGGGGEGQGDGPPQREGGGTDAVPPGGGGPALTWTGWVREDGSDEWRFAASGPDEGGVWALTLAHEVATHKVERLVTWRPSPNAQPAPKWGRVRV